MNKATQRTDIKNVQENIATFLLAQKPSRKGTTNDILHCRDLYTEGWLDSLLVLQLIAYLEKNMSLRIPIFMVTKNTFQNVDSIVALLEHTQDTSHD